MVEYLAMHTSRRVKSAFAAILAAGLLAGCAPEAEVVEEVEVAEATPPDATVTIRAVGDMLIHSDVYTTASTGEGFDFSGMFDEMRPYLEGADITTANMEVPVAGPEFELSGYPMFNAPPEIIDALQGAGVDIVNNATNHAMDRGGEGMEASTSNMRSRGMPYVGGYASPEDKAMPRIIAENGLKVGFLAYTYGTNGLPIPQEHLVSLIDHDVMREEISALEKQVDIVVTMLHMGEEYAPLPVDFQRETAQVAIDAGADLILGGHPHVVQPFEVADDHAVWWSHGNFLHGQWEEETKVGGVGEFTFTRRGDGSLHVDRVRYMPTYTVGPPISYDHHVIPLVQTQDYLDVAGWMDELNARLNVEVVDYL